MNVLRSAAQKLAEGQRREIAGKKHGGYRRGAMPSDTGNLMRSLVASRQSVPVTDGREGNNVAVEILLWQPGQTLWLGYTAEYGPRMNYGFVGTDKLGRNYNQTGYFFIERGVSEWPQYLKEAENEQR